MIVDRTLLNRFSTDMLVIKGTLSRISDQLNRLENSANDVEASSNITTSVSEITRESLVNISEVIQAHFGQSLEHFQGSLEAGKESTLVFPPVTLPNNAQVEFGASPHTDLIRDGSSHNDMLSLDDRFMGERRRRSRISI